jgi:unsaturated chondroitin disaccharide hydrolase
MTDAVSDLVRRVDGTLRLASGRFPAYADAGTGEWTWSADGGWFGGFWPGLLWLSAVATGDDMYARAAAHAAARLRPRLTAATVLRGDLFWYSSAIGFQLGQAGPDVAEQAIDAAWLMSDDFDKNTGLLPPGEEDAIEYDWPRPGACIDGLPGTTALLGFAAKQTHDDALLSVAESHARGHIALCVRDDGSVAQSATYDASGQMASQRAINGSSQDSTWARAQAWGMLGLAQAAHLAPEFTAPATAVADWYLTHVPGDGVCYWDFDDPAIPDSPRDTSATAIAAAALAKLAPLAGDQYRHAGQDTLAALTADHTNDHGALIDGCYNQRKGVATSNELIWGDYFMLEAALALDDRLDTALI